MRNVLDFNPILLASLNIPTQGDKNANIDSYEFDVPEILKLMRKYLKQSGYEEYSFAIDMLSNVLESQLIQSL